MPADTGTSTKLPRLVALKARNAKLRKPPRGTNDGVETHKNDASDEAQSHKELRDGRRNCSERHVADDVGWGKKTGRKEQTENIKRPKQTTESASLDRAAS